MKIDRIPNVHPTSPETLVTLKVMGNVKEIRFMSGQGGCPIQKLDKDHGMDVRTGEVIEYRHRESRAEDQQSVAQSLRKLRDVINANLSDPKTAIWETLTYAENMKDAARLYQDYRRFWQRFKYYLNEHGYPPAEYITAAEPQGRGAWHLHCLFLFPERAPFIPNQEIARIWRHGFTKTKSLRNIDNPGLYLTAYLGDMELHESIKAGTFDAKHLVELSGQDGSSKAVIKGARLKLYPPGFNLYRFSRGIKRPIVYQVTEAEALNAVADSNLTYEKTISVTDACGDTKNIINYRTYTRQLDQ